MSDEEKKLYPNLFPPDLVSLKEHFIALMAAQDKAVKVQLDAHNAIHAAESKSIDVARSELTHWKQAHNDWQRQMQDSRTTFLSKEEFYRAHGDYGKKIDDLSKWVYIAMGMCIIVPVFIQVLIFLLKK
jgi:hypothetical protein